MHASMHVCMPVYIHVNDCYPRLNHTRASGLLQDTVMLTSSPNFRGYPSASASALALAPVVVVNPMPSSCLLMLDLQENSLAEFVLDQIAPSAFR